MPDDVREWINGAGHILSPLVGTFPGYRFAGRRLYRSSSPLRPYIKNLAGPNGRPVSQYNLVDMAVWAAASYQLNFGESHGSGLTVSDLKAQGFTEIFRTPTAGNETGFDAIAFLSVSNEVVVLVEGSTTTLDWALNLATISPLESQSQMDAAWGFAEGLRQALEFNQLGLDTEIRIAAQSLGTLGAVLFNAYLDASDYNKVESYLFSEPSAYASLLDTFLQSHLGQVNSAYNNQGLRSQFILDLKDGIQGFSFANDAVNMGNTSALFAGNTIIGPEFLFEGQVISSGITSTGLIDDPIRAHSAALIADFLTLVQESDLMGQMEASTGGVFFMGARGNLEYFPDGSTDAGSVTEFSADIIGASPELHIKYSDFKALYLPDGAHVVDAGSLSDGAFFQEYQADGERIHILHKVVDGKNLIIYESLSDGVPHVFVDGNLVVGVEATNLISTIGGNPLEFGNLFATIGSSLGSLLGTGNVLTDIAATSLLGTVALNLGQALDSAGPAAAAALAGSAVGDVSLAFGDEFFAQLQGAAIGSASSILSLELGEALGLEGFGAELFSTVSSSVLEKVFTNAIHQPISPMSWVKGINVESAFGNLAGTTASGVTSWNPGFLSSAVGAFLGSKLGSMVVAPTTQAGAVLSSVGSAAGAYMFGVGASASGAIGSFATGLAQGLGKWIGNIVVPGLGAFIGFVLGALIGNLFGKKRPKIPTADAETVLNFDSGYYQVGAVSAINGGNEDLVLDMASAARDTLNGIISLISGGAEEVGNVNQVSPTQVYGHTASQIWVKLGGSAGAPVNFSSADQAVEYGALWAISGTKIVGGDLYLKRALNVATADSLVALAGNLQVAEDYRNYVENAELIDEAISATYDSLSAADKAFYDANQDSMTLVLAKDAIPLTGADLAWYNANATQADGIVSQLHLTQFAAGWIITLQRAAELGLNKAAPSDFYGGMGGFADSVELMLGVELFYEDLSIGFDGDAFAVWSYDRADAAFGPDGQWGGVPASSWGTNWGSNVPFGDSGVGSVNWRSVDTSGASTLSLQTVAGPDSTGQMLTVRRSDTGEVILSQTPAATQQWTTTDIALPVGVTSVDIQLEDAGAAWGQWSAIAPLRFTGFGSSTYVWSDQPEPNEVGSGWGNGGPNPGVSPWGSRWSSYAVSGDPGTGTLAFRDLETNGARSVELMLQTGPVSTNQRVVLRDAVTNVAFLDTEVVDLVHEWGKLSFDIPTGVTAIDVEIIDTGANWGEWIAVSGPRLADAPAFTLDNFLADVGYTQLTGPGQNTSLNDIWIHDGGAITMDDWRQETVGHWEVIWVTPSEPETVWVEVTVTRTGGDDIFVSGYGDDTLRGRAGHDWLDGQSGHDTLLGDEGDDVLLGRDGNDILFGDADNDYLAGGSGADELHGGSGDDTLADGRETDTLFGDGGDDVFIVEDDGHADTLNGGSGADAISLERWASTSATIDLATGSIFGNALTSVENVVGSQGDDTIYGDAGANRLSGSGGDDFIDARNGSDVLEGGAGADELHGGAGLDTASYISSRSAVWVDLTTGEAFGGHADGDEIFAIESLEGSVFADTFTGTSGANTFHGGRGDDWFVATAGADAHHGDEDFDTVDYSGSSSAITVNTKTNIGSGLAAGHSFFDIEHIVGTDFADAITMGDGDDAITGGAGNDILNGGLGADLYIYRPGDGYDQIIGEQEVGGGYDTLLVTDSNWNDIWIGTPSAGLEVRVGGAANRVWVANNFSNYYNNEQMIDALDIGGSGAIDLSKVNGAVGGTSANNTLYGSVSTHDIVMGLAGDDYLYTAGSPTGWEQNNNILWGGAGNDVLYASVGDDQYIFERGDGIDWIRDAGGDDRIQFGPNVSVEDLIYEIVGQDLIIGIRDLSDPTLTAIQVADHMRVVDGGTKFIGQYSNMITLNTVEYLTAGGVDLDVRKLGIAWNWVTVWEAPPGGGGGGNLPPIVIDLDGDGIELIGVDETRVVFRSDSGGPLMRVAWVGADDGFLALDRDGDGAINHLREISFTSDLEGATTDLEGLRAFDSNHNGVLDGKDERWSDFRIWQDVNQNGRSSERELMTLKEAGITSIDLEGRGTGATTIGMTDSVVVNTAIISWADETRVGDAYDVALAWRLAHIDGLATGLGREEWASFDYRADGEFGVAKHADKSKGDGVADLAQIKVSEADQGKLAPRQALEFYVDDADELAPAAKRSKDPDAPKNRTSPVSPVVFDLDGDGIELISPQQSPVLVDLDDDGGLDRLGWISPDDGILALDRNGDGVISVTGEISFIHDLVGATTDLEGLVAFDTNNDGWLDAEDSQFSNFRVWRDIDTDGLSQAGELSTLVDAGIARLRLSYVDSSEGSVPGGELSNTIFGNALFVRSDGSEGVLADVQLTAWLGDGGNEADEQRTRDLYEGYRFDRAGPWAFDANSRADLLNGGGIEEAIDLDQLDTWKEAGSPFFGAMAPYSEALNHSGSSPAFSVPIPMNDEPSRRRDRGGQLSLLAPFDAVRDGRTGRPRASFASPTSKKVRAEFSRDWWLSRPQTVAEFDLWSGDRNSDRGLWFEPSQKTKKMSGSSARHGNAVQNRGSIKSQSIELVQAQEQLVQAMASFGGDSGGPDALNRRSGRVDAVSRMISADGSRLNGTATLREYML